MMRLACSAMAVALASQAHATDFVIRIADAEMLAGITAAREAYNTIQAKGTTPITDADYVQLVMEGAAASYAKALVVDKDASISSLESEKAVLEGRIEALEAELAAEKLK